MDLFHLIIKASVLKDTEAAWELILRFKPYIRKICFDPEKKCVNEDMVSDIVIHLHKRILGFEVRFPCEGED